MAGLIIPREGGLAIALTEKLEDMVSIIFLPIVRPFASSNNFYLNHAVFHTLRIVDQPRVTQ